jgi:hypothetical protein
MVTNGMVISPKSIPLVDEPSTPVRLAASSVTSEFLVQVRTLHPVNVVKPGL